MASGKQIWEEIKDKDIDVFAMTGKISQYCEFIEIDPAKCYLVCKASAALPALETALGEKFTCTLTEKYVLVEKK